MATRYKLVGSRYQAWNKTKKYDHEEEAMLHGTSLKSLFEIDAFTCDKTLYEALSLLEFAHDKQLKNHLAINNTYSRQKPFLDAIFDYPEMQEIIKSKTSKDVRGLGEPPKYQSTISLEIPLASQLWNPIYEALLERNEAALKTLLDQEGSFYTQVCRYLTSYYDPSEENEVLTQLKKQFSVYTNFRETFVYQKLKKEEKQTTPKTGSSFIFTKKRLQLSVKTTYDMSALPSYIVPSFTSADKEEFLTDEELNYSYNDVPLEQGPLLVKKVNRG